MENATALAAIMGPAYLVVGLSVLIYAGAWKTLISGWRKDHLSLYALMFVYLVLGLVVVRMYNVWEWNLWLLVTLTGWCMLVKSVIYFILPGSTTKGLLALGENTGLLYLGGLVATVIGAFLTYNIYFAAAAVVPVL